MAVTKTLIKAIPSEKANKVEEWDLEMKYENDSEGDATYYVSYFKHIVFASEGDFTAAAKGTFNLADLIALCPTSHWDTSFAVQVDHVITNPPVVAVPDNNFTVPSS